MSDLKKIPLYLRKPIFEKLFNIAEYTNLNKKEKDMYDTELKRKWDNKAVMDFHEDKGRKEASAKKEFEFVSNLFENTEFDDARIASLAGVTPERVQEIRAEMKKKKEID